MTLKELAYEKAKETGHKEIFPSDIPDKGIGGYIATTCVYDENNEFVKEIFQEFYYPLFTEDGYVFTTKLVSAEEFVEKLEKESIIRKSDNPKQLQVGIMAVNDRVITTYRVKISALRGLLTEAQSEKLKDLMKE